MTKQMRVVGLLATIAVVTTGATALGANVKLGPVKGASYAGAVHDETITIKVAANGKTAKVSLPGAPAFCQGGSGPEKQSSKAAKVSKTGSLTAKISYSSTIGASHAAFATVMVKGNFDTFAGSKPVFEGTVKTSFRAAGSESCDGQESFEATEL